MDGGGEGGAKRAGEKLLGEVVEGENLSSVNNEISEDEVHNWLMRK